MDKDELLLDAEERMEKALAALERDYGKLRTGRATTGLVEDIKVDYYGTPTPIKQLASVAVPDSRTVTIQPWDRVAFALVEKAILKSDLGLTPMNDGKLIRIAIPPLTEDRRKELTKIARKYTEEAKVAIRNIRRDANEHFKKQNKANETSQDDMKDLETVAKKYRHFLNVGKTERECITQIVKEAEEAGYVSLEEKVKNGEDLKAGDKVYQVGMQKIIALYHIGEEDLAQGMNILCAHIDSPRLDIKQNPLYEDTDLAYLDTHYYGGVKKYQWVALPMAMHGVIVKKDGTVVTESVGEDEDDPVLYITDLLIHLAGQQMAKKASEAVEGEKLDILIGSQPLKDLPDDEKKEAVKENVLRILNEKYGVEEEDFLSAELEIVPAGKARDCGLDRSMVLAYGQDDRVCAFTSLFAMLDVEEVEHTACCILVDKEEIGSVGATGMHSRFFENTVAELVALTEGESDLKVRRALMNSRMLSSDVSAAYDPMYAEVFEKRSSAFFGKGLVFNKFTGARGKSGSNDANAEYLAKIRNAMDVQSVAYQFAELGKVDAGGGGTIAYIMANYGMEVIDSGVAVLSMHAPWEVTSKADVYEAYKGYKAFIEEMK